MVDSAAPAGGQAPAVRRATIKDVADASGVSRSTVSRVLTGRGYVAPPVRLRVQQSVEQLGYVPDAMARHLKAQVSKSIGVLVSDLRNGFYADLAAGASQEARKRGYTVMLADDRGSAADELEAAHTFAGLRVAGVIVTPVSAAGSGYLRRYGVPVVEVDRQFAEDDCDAVVVDNRSCALAATEHLVSHGHRRIALLIDETDWTTGRERFAGYQAGLVAAGAPFDPRLVVSCGWDVEDARAAALELLQRRSRPTALFAANNLLAEGAWRAIAQLGLRIPSDVSLVAFDDAPWMSMVTPGVTAIAQDAGALGEAAVARLLDRIAEPTTPTATIVIPARLQVRGSTGRVSRGSASRALDPS